MVTSAVMVYDLLRMLGAPLLGTLIGAP